MRRKFIKTVLAMGAAAGALPGLGMRSLRAQPTATVSGKPIEWVVGFAAGGGSDAVARIVAEAWSPQLGRPTVVLNKPGAGTNVAAEYVARSRDYGNLVFTADFATLAANPHLFRKLGYDAEKDFAPIGMLARFPLFLVVNNDLHIRSFQEFTAWAKSNPDSLAYGTPGLGTPHHLASELLAQHLAVRMTHVPYRGAGPAMLDVIGGQIPFMIVDSAAGVSHIAAGKVRVIGVASATRLASHPDVPTLAEQGAKGLEAHAWQGLVAPVNTSEASIQTWSAALQTVLNSPAVQARFAALALEPMPGTPQQMRDYWQSEKQRWGHVIQTAGISLD